MNLAGERSSQSELIGGARLNFLFQDWFAAHIMDMDPLKNMPDFEILTAIRNGSGSNRSLFIPENSFEVIVKRSIGALLHPLLHLVHQSANELRNIYEYPHRQAQKFSPETCAHTCVYTSSVKENQFSVASLSCPCSVLGLHEITELAQYSKLSEAIREVVRNCLERNQDRTLSRCRDIIDIEMTYINKSNPEFIQQKILIQNSLRSHEMRSSSGRRASDGRCESTGSGNLGPIPAVGGGINLAGLVTVGGAAAGARSNDATTNAVGTVPGGSARTGDLPVINVEDAPDLPNVLSVSPGSQPPSGRPAAGGFHGYIAPSSTFMSYWRRHPIASAAPRAEPTPRAVPDNDAIMIETVKQLIRSYFNIVKKQLADLAPKIIMHSLVNATLNDVQPQLISNLYDDSIRPPTPSSLRPPTPSVFDHPPHPTFDHYHLPSLSAVLETILSENLEVSQRREKLNEQKRLLARATHLLDQIAG